MADTPIERGRGVQIGHHAVDLLAEARADARTLRRAAEAVVTEYLNAKSAAMECGLPFVGWLSVENLKSALAAAQEPPAKGDDR